jgi:hypothetical protein
MALTNAQILNSARERARAQGLPYPRTAAEVEELAGVVYTGPDPEAIGKTYTVPVMTWNSDHQM